MPGGAASGTVAKNGNKISLEFSAVLRRSCAVFAVCMGKQCKSVLMEFRHLLILDGQIIIDSRSGGLRADGTQAPVS